MNPLALLNDLQQQGFTLHPLPGGRLEVRPASRLSEDLRKQLVRHKREILILLTEEILPHRPAYQKMTWALPDDAHLVDAWLCDHHPALWQRIRALDDELIRLEQEGVPEEVYRAKLYELLDVCQQARSLRDGTWSALLVRSAVLGGEQVWVVETLEEAAAVQGDGHAVYLADEIRALKGKPPEQLRDIHQAKLAHPGRLVQELYTETAREEHAVREAIRGEQTAPKQGALWEIPEDGPHIEVAPAFETPAYEVVTAPSQLERLLPRLLETPVLGLDTETTGLDPLAARLRLVQLATPDQVLVVDVDCVPVPLLAPLFSQPGREVLVHNATFDLQFLTAAGLPWPCQVFDTMLMPQILGAGSPEGRLDQSGLAVVVQRYLGVTVSKEEQQSQWDGALSREQWAYAARDAAVLLPLADRLKQDVQAAGLERVADIENRCVPALAWLELAGLPVDAERWLARASREEERVRDLEAQLHALTGRDVARLQLQERPFINWQSPAQVLEVLRSRGHQLQSTDSATLTALADPLAQTLLAYRDALIRAQTFGREWLEKHHHPITGRVHARYLQCGSEAGRMSCTKPNVQNIPRGAEYRGCIRPEQGFCIVKADFSQIELRVAAVLANDSAMLAAFRKGQDLHALTASKVVGIPLDQVGKDHRQVAKSLNFGLLYGMGARRLREYAANSYKVLLSEAEAEHHKRAFFRAYPFLDRWHRQTAARLEREKVIETRTLAGRRRLGVQYFTNALNTPVQGSGADGLKLALARLFAHRQEAPSARLVTCVHDELVAECPSEDAEQTARWLKQHMTAAMQEIIGNTVPIEVETTIGQDWAGTPVSEEIPDPGEPAR